MQQTLKAIEELKLNKTQEKILNYLSIKDNKESTLKDMADSIDVIYVTLCNEVKKLVSKDILYMDDTAFKLTSFGQTLDNFNSFKKYVLRSFCNINNLDDDTYKGFINNKNYNNMKLLLGIKNLITKKD